MSLQEEDKRRRDIHRGEGYLYTEVAGGICPQAKERQGLLAELWRGTEALTFELPGGNNPADIFDLGLLASLL